MLLEKYASVFNYLGMHHLFLLSPLLFSLFMVAEVFVLTFLKQACLLQWGQDFFVFCFVIQYSACMRVTMREKNKGKQ